MTNDDVNYYGLHFEAAEFASNGPTFTVLTAGGHIPAVGNYVYAKTEAPDLKTVDYYFGRPGVDPMPGAYGFSLTNTTPPVLVAGFGQTFQIGGYARQQLQMATQMFLPIWASTSTMPR